MKSDKDWCQKWFNSPYNSILYKNRDVNEAKYFIDNILKIVPIRVKSLIYDLGCGEGRHSFYLNQLGFEVCGTDISEEKIKTATIHSSENLHFYIHDMRFIFRVNYFDLAINLFTSFGYFNTKREDLNVLKSVNLSLKPNGIFVLDYLNHKVIVQKLVEKEFISINDIGFTITRKVENGFLIKTIDVIDKGQNQHFIEKVKMLDYTDFCAYFEKSNFRIIQTFGDYHLNKFDQEISERMIFVLKKLNG